MQISQDPMQFVCSQSDLSTHLSLVSRAVPSRPTHPILGNVLCQADEQTQRVSLIAYDLSLGMETSFAAQVIEGGTLTLPAKLLNDIVSRLLEGEISLITETAEDNLESVALATLVSASGRFQMRGIDPEDFPSLPVIEEGDTLNVSPDLLIEGLRGTLFAASPDETKQVLTGVHVTYPQDSLEFAATDGHRLAVVQTTSELEDSEETSKTIVQFSGNVKDFAVTIPARALRELERMLATYQKSDPLHVRFDEGQVIFEVGEQRLTSRKLEGQYPAYNDLIPRQFSRTMIVERKRLLSSLELVAVFADQKNNIVKFTLDSEEQQLSLSIEAQDVGNAKESMSAQISGESLEIAFNVKYLMDGLKSLPATDIQIHFNEGNQPVIFTPLGGLKMTYLVMPVQIRN